MANKFVKLGRKALLLGCTSLLLFGSTIPAYANGDDPSSDQVVENVEVTVNTDETLTEPEPETETEVLPERVIGEDPDSAFSVPGNAQVLDDITDSGSKEFFTIQTANNKTYYIVVDRSSTTDNVYMLSTIDENDLKEFLNEEETETEAPTQSVVLPENVVTPEETEATETEEPEKEDEKGGLNTGALGSLAVLVAAGVVGAYYLKKKKAQKEADDDVNEGMEYGETYRSDDDDEEYVIEDYNYESPEADDESEE